MAAFVEVVSSVKFSEYVKKNIFIPLNMENYSFSVDDNDLNKLVEQYAFSEQKGLHKRDKSNMFKLGSEYESGGCISTLKDYVKVLEALRIGNIILKKETIDLLATNQQ